jgi:elongator complex protein 5
MILQKEARERAREEPRFGVEEGVEGVLMGMNDGGLERKERGCVVEMEFRRKSGRGIREWFFLPSIPDSTFTAVTARQRHTNTSLPKGAGWKQTIILVEDHPLYNPPSLKEEAGEVDANAGPDDSTFSLSLTAKQREAREGVVLPYYDAQRDGGASGAGEGGRILYDMEAEDDFDEEEDEI